MKKSSLWKRLLNVILVLLLVLTVLLLVGGLILGIYVASITEREIDQTVFEVLSSNTASKIYYYKSESDRQAGIATELEGQELFGGYRSLPKNYDQIPEDLINAFISIEDKRFFEHSGVDWKRTAGAAINFIFKFDDEFGGSTITQQLIKNVTERDEYSAERKLQEIMWALDLETKMSKKEILENYLNIINLSNGCYGVGAAAKYYFGKDIGDLTLLECASIAAITNNPSYYDPTRNPQNNLARASLILLQMKEQGYISEEEYTEANGSELVLSAEPSVSDGINLWYIDMVISDVINDLMIRYGYTRSMANMMIYRGGLRI
ncbi:MAG: transglycosylase domain-containing protein, partial [Clostridia bacterium]|nr:transglycosylase domain-containing protein [Clostridia bacterium]